MHRRTSRDSPRGTRSRTTAVVAMTATVSLVLAAWMLASCRNATDSSAPTTAGVPDDVDPAAFNSGVLRGPASYTHRFPNGGMFNYHCTFHVEMGMRGTVTVANGAPDSAVVLASGSSFTPASVSVRPGGHVRWDVPTGMHTVTSN